MEGAILNTAMEPLGWNFFFSSVGGMIFLDILLAWNLGFLAEYDEVTCAMDNSQVRPRFAFTSLGCVDLTLWSPQPFELEWYSHNTRGLCVECAETDKRSY